MANNSGFDDIFSRTVEALGRLSDTLLVISTSGNSENILRAASAAKAVGMYVVTLTGKDGGKLAGMYDVEIRAPRNPYSDLVGVIHLLVQLVEESLPERM